MEPYKQAFTFGSQLPGPDDPKYKYAVYMLTIMRTERTFPYVPPPSYIINITVSEQPQAA